MEKYNLTQTGQEVQDILNNATPQSDLAEEVERAQEAERLLGEGVQQNADDIDSIEGKIPSAATSENKLTDKEYVDGLVDDEKNRAQDAEQQNANDIDAIEAIIPSNASSENKLATSNDVDTVAQSVGTEETRAKAAEKQNADDIDAIESVIPLDATSENKLATLSDITTEATTRENEDAALQSAIEAILLLIPSAASSLNQLADKAFVNSSIATNTATFRGTFNLVNDLHLTLAATHAQIGNALSLAILESDNSDYAYVQIPTVETAPNEIAQTDRYKFNGTAWEYEYTLNNSGFTSAQWTAINSGITSVLVSKLSELPTNSELTTDLGTLTSAITAINQKIPAAAAQNNKLVDTAALESYIVQVLGVLTVSYNITSTDGHVTLAIQQTDGKITSVSLTTSDIASAAALNLKASQADLTALASRVTTAEGNITTLGVRMTTAEGNITSLGGRMTTAEGNITTLGDRVSKNETDIANLQQLYNNLQQSKPVPVPALPSTGQQQGVIYRLTGTTSYSDYMWNGSTWVLMATYNNAIDPRPKKASQNLVTSGGVFDNMGALDISELNATENPHTLATYANLSAALAAIPSNDYKKGGMSIKFVQTDDNKYVQYRLTSQYFSTNVAEWQIENLDIIPDYVGTHTPFIVSDYTLWTSLASGVTQDGNTFTFATSANMSSYIGVNGSAVLQKVKSFIGKKVRVELVFNASGDYAHLTSGDLQQYKGTYTAQGKDVSGTIWKFWADLVVTSSWNHFFVPFSMSGAQGSAVLELSEVNCYLSENENYEDSPNIELIKFVADKEVAPVKEDLDALDANISNIVGSRTPIEVKSPQIWAQMASGASQDGNTFTFATSANMSSYIGILYDEVYQAVEDCVGKKIKVELLYSVSGDYAHLKSGNLTPFSGTPTEQKKEISGTTWKFSCECVVADWVRFYISFYMQSAISSATLTFLGANVYYVEDEDYGEDKNVKLIKAICNETYDKDIKETLIYCFSKSGTDDATHFYGLKAIAKALDSITDATYNNRYRLIIDGTYHFTDPLDLTMFGDSEYSVAYCKPFVSLEGTGKDKCVIFVDIAPNSTFHEGMNWYDYQPIYISCEGEVNVSNMTIIGKNCRYTIHLERDPDRIGGVKRTIKNCNVIHLGLNGYQNSGFCHAFGTGMGYDHIWNIEDCYIESAISSSFAMHSELGLPAYRQGIVNFKNNTFKGDINFSEYPQNSEAFVNFIGSNIFKDTFIGVVPMYRAGMYKLGNYMTTKIKMDNVAIPVYNNFFRGMVLRFDAVNDNQTITILTSPSVSSAFVDIIGDALDRGQYLTDECFIAENGYFRREGASNFKAFAFGSIDCDESATTGYRSLGKLLGDCSVTNKKLTLKIGGTYKTVTFSEDLSEKDNAYVLNIINTALSGYAVASVFCPARYQYPEVKGQYTVVCAESTPILRGMGVVYTSGGVRKATNADGYIDGIALDDFGQNQYGRIITEGSIYANHKRESTSYFFTSLESNNTQRNIGDALGISVTDAGIFDIDATPKILRATGIDILKIL